VSAAALLLKKINVLQVCWLTKTMTKKLTATPNTALSFGGVSRAVALALFGFVLLLMFIFCRRALF
jgi:hypothetical protein